MTHHDFKSGRWMLLLTAWLALNSQTLAAITNTDTMLAATTDTTHHAADTIDSTGSSVSAVDTITTLSVMDRLNRNRLFSSTYLGVPLIAGGLIEKHYDSKFRRLRNDFMPEFHRTLDNYTQMAPAAVLLGLKVAGVPSRSSWGRMLLGDALSTALMTGVVQGLKFTTDVKRPDGSNSHSFPSGHTATAFMTATMLSKEYGHLSPWISVGGYSVATATGLMRMANNKHWLSDVMVGAGIGILSTEFGYWIADAICGNKGLLMSDKTERWTGGKHTRLSLSLHRTMVLPAANPAMELVDKASRRIYPLHEY